MARQKKRKQRQYGTKYQWTPAKYKSIILGNKESNIPGLRSIAEGFEKEDGFNVDKITKKDGSFSKYFSATKRAKIRQMFHRVELLMAQPKRLVRARGENLEKLKAAFHGEVPSKGFKVAFIPDTEPMLRPGLKRVPPKIRVLKEGVSIQRPQYERIFVPFNAKRLVKDATQEIKNAASKMKGASVYFVQVGEYQTLNGMSLGILTRQVLDWMQQYDGKRPLPNSSGNKGDDPKHHHWKKWLEGLVGYVLPRNVDPRMLMKIIREGRQKNEDQARQRKNFMKRIRIKAKRQPKSKG